MRNALRVLVLGALIGCGLALGTGQLLLLRLEAGALRSTATSALALGHSVTGHVVAVAACVVASMALLLGVHGLLEAGGRRIPSAALFLLAPCVMGLAFAAALSGHAIPDTAPGQRVDAFTIDDLRSRHGLVPGSLLAVSLAATAAAAWWLLKSTRNED